MYAEHPSIDDRSERKIVKHLTAPPPHVATPVLALAFIVEAIDLRNLAGFVVSADKGHTFRIAYFQGEQEEKRLDAVEPPVNEVAYEDAE